MPGRARIAADHGRRYVRTRNIARMRVGRSRVASVSRRWSVVSDGSAGGVVRRGCRCGRMRGSARGCVRSDRGALGRCDRLISIKRVLAGDGYRYLLRGIADHEDTPGVSAVTAYYAQPGNPPGQWIGTGLAGLGEGAGLRPGAQVSEQQLERMFHDGADPLTGEPLGRPFYHSRSPRERAATPAPEAVERPRKVPRPVAAFDVTFSPSKSVSVLWGLGDQGVREQIYEAHRAAIADVLTIIERDVARTRIGANGVAQVQTRGVIAAGFDHWDSRSGDPQLHTHVLIANRVQGAHDGKWRTLDSRGALFPSVVAMSELYDNLLADHLTARVGVAWENRGTKHKTKNTTWEIAGVPAGLIAGFSTRGTDIEAEKDRLIDAYRRDHGRSPTDQVVLKLRQIATLATRPAKEHRPLSELTTDWAERAQVALGEDPAVWAGRLTRFAEDTPAPVLWRVDDLVAIGVLDEIAREAFDELATERSTWTQWNVHAAVARAAMAYRMADAGERDRLIATVADLVVAMSVDLTPPEASHVPAVFRRIDGVSAFAPPRVFTSAEILAAEQRLLQAGRTVDAATVPADVVEQVVSAPTSGVALSEDQADAVTAIAVSGRRVDVLLGPAGAGKTTALAALRAVWETEHGLGSVMGLAPSAVAAEVLAEALDIGTDNTAKWLHETAQRSDRDAERQHLHVSLAAMPLGDPGRRVPEARIARLDEVLQRWQFTHGQLVIVDEASMAGTLALDTIAAHAAQVGARVLLVGDYAQLGSVDAGGAFGMLARDRGDLVPELSGVRRFREPWERAASVRLRVGDTNILDTYDQHGRIRDGDHEDMLNAAYTAWRTDETAGKTSLLIAGSSHTVRDLNTRARTDLATAGTVEPDGVVLHDGTLAGKGDRVVTRHNDRRLTTGRSWVKNADTWTVQHRHHDGSLTVRRLRGHGSITLPAGYVRQHVELAYATTAHRAQGVTVDTAHVLVTAASMVREVFYVAMTRARNANTAYVAIDDVPEDDRHLDEDQRTAMTVLHGILRRRGAALSATETTTELHEQARSIRQLADEYTTIAAHAAAHRWNDTITTIPLPDGAGDPTTSPAYPVLIAAMNHAHAAGLDVARLFPRLAQARELDTADDPIAVLHHRLDHVTEHAELRGHKPAGRFIVGLIPAADTHDDPDLTQALSEREHLLEARATELLQRAIRDQPPWLAWLGARPTDADKAAAWDRCAAIVAACRERHDITDHNHPLGTPTSSAARDRRRAEHALTYARQLDGHDRARPDEHLRVPTIPTTPAAER